MVIKLVRKIVYIHRAVGDHWLNKSAGQVSYQGLAKAEMHAGLTDVNFNQ